ncbi:MAG: hypothetical protein KJ066_18415 [Acidobacteria bacterium]|nr:hypothetical protein [Acidobacteriota bacterium]
MSRHTGGEKVNAGFYLNMESWEVSVLSGQGGLLAGDQSARYLRIPALALLVFIPLMGAAFAMFLPFIGIALVLQFLSTKVVDAGREAFRWLAAAVTPAWRPGEAHFTGSPKSEKKKSDEADQAVEARLKALEDEIDGKEK